MNVEYINPWMNDYYTGEPQIYKRQQVNEVLDYRGFKVYKIHAHHYDWVYRGVCVGQRAGVNIDKAKGAIDSIIGNWIKKGDESSEKIRRNMIEYEKYMMAL